MTQEPKQNRIPIRILKGICLGILLVATWMILRNSLTAAQFTAVATVWVLIYIVISIDPDTITEVRLWAASIKRDVEAAKSIRAEVAETKEGIRQVAHAMTEISYYMLKFGFVTGSSRRHPLSERLEIDLKTLTRFVEPDEQKRNEWLAMLTAEPQKE